VAASPRYRADDLREYAGKLLLNAGLEPPLAACVADVLVEGDLMGHDTHGLALLAPYLAEISKGSMALAGVPSPVSDSGPLLTWDARRLPGPWVVRTGFDELVARARRFGLAALSVRRSHHIACLAAYLPRVTGAGMLALIASSDPTVASVAPHGGTRPVFTPNPLAVGIPATDHPILIDISASITTNGMSARLARAGQQFDEEWLLDADGRPTRDPAVLAAKPPGTILPLGGLAAGHKGYGLALAIEALTSALSGLGRADPPEGWGASLFMLVIDPASAAGSDAFLRQIDWLADSCRGNPPRPGFEAVRMPGDRAWQRRIEQLRDGVSLHPSIVPALVEAGARSRVSFPDPL
jgi:LDH2 family malate/lactate/ureidoglycolate dehydrogenase